MQTDISENLEDARAQYIHVSLSTHNIPLLSFCHKHLHIPHTHTQAHTHTAIRDHFKVYVAGAEGEMYGQYLHTNTTQCFN